MEITLPLTSTGRKYGYITWSKANESAVRELLGDVQSVSLVLANKEPKTQNVDWKHHRISLGYSNTRSIPPEITTIRLIRVKSGSIRVLFS